MIDHGAAEKRGPKGTPQTEDSSTKAAAHASPVRPRVLVVEDDFFVSMEIETALTDAGFEVVGPANTAEDAEQYAAEQKPDLAIMDIRLLSRRDGVDAALAIFNATGIRSIFATAHEDPHTRERAAPAKPLAWIAKPYPMDALVVLIRRALKEMKS
jgi:DNA-binding NarL/FixJ family response regulator